MVRACFLVFRFLVCVLVSGFDSRLPVTLCVMFQIWITGSCHQSGVTEYFANSGSKLLVDPTVDLSYYEKVANYIKAAS